MQGRRSSMVTLKFSSNPPICYMIFYLLPKLFYVSNIAVHALPPQVASMPVVWSDLNWSFLACLYSITYQDYNVICIFFFTKNACQPDVVSIYDEWESVSASILVELLLYRTWIESI